MKILTVDDDINSLKSLGQLLELKKHEQFPHLTSGDALTNLAEIEPDLAILDLQLEETTGIELMKTLHDIKPNLPVVILTASREVKSAIEALKSGAYNYLTKPVQPDELFGTLDNVARELHLSEENKRLRSELSSKYRFENIVGQSEPLKKLFHLLSKAAETKSTILITGASGTGKELVAKAVHYNSNRKDGAFIKINCAAIPESMLEAELFGIEKNVATGVAKRAGKFELADGGSIFLDEIGEMSSATQAKLLRVLQEREVERIGSSRAKKIDIRIIAATNINIENAVEEKNFREDLYYRLNVIHIALPSLMERAEDIPLLAQHFLEKYCKENSMQLKKIDARGMEYLQKHDWPGNIRELENKIERAVAVSDELITIEDFGITKKPVASTNAAASHEVQNVPEGSTLDDMVEAYEKRLLLKVLEDNRWKQNKTAEVLGISERSIWYKIKKLGIDAKKSE